MMLIVSKFLIRLVAVFLPVPKWRRFFKNKLLNLVIKPEIKKEHFCFPESKLAHELLDGLRGIEIGGSGHNQFGLKTLNIDFTDENNYYQQLDKQVSGNEHCLHVDIVTLGDDLPFKDGVWDFVINSHVIEHFFDPIKTIKEWLRVIKNGGYLYMIVPHKERTFDKDKPITQLSELIDRHSGKLKISDYGYNNTALPTEFEYVIIKDGYIPEKFARMTEDNHMHWNIWDTAAFVDMCKYMNLNIIAVQDVDDKVGNVFTIVIKK